MEFVVGGVAAVLVALITGWFGLAVAKLQRAVGKPNGEGNVVQMNERILVALGRLEERFDGHLREFHSTAAVRPQERFRVPGPLAVGFRTNQQVSHGLSGDDKPQAPGE